TGRRVTNKTPGEGRNRELVGGDPPRARPPGTPPAARLHQFPPPRSVAPVTGLAAAGKAPGTIADRRNAAGLHPPKHGTRLGADQVRSLMTRHPRTRHRRYPAAIATTHPRVNDGVAQPPHSC